MMKKQIKEESKALIDQAIAILKSIQRPCEKETDVHLPMFKWFKQVTHSIEHLTEAINNAEIIPTPKPVEEGA